MLLTPDLSRYHPVAWRYALHLFNETFGFMPDVTELDVDKLDESSEFRDDALQLLSMRDKPICLAVGWEAFERFDSDGVEVCFEEAVEWCQAELGEEGDAWFGLSLENDWLRCILFRDGQDAMLFKMQPWDVRWSDFGWSGGGRQK